MSLFFVSRVFFVLQFNISSRNSAQKDGGRPHDLRATNSRIRGEERRGKKKRKDSGQVGKLPPTDLHFLESWEDERRTLERESVDNFSRAYLRNFSNFSLFQRDRVIGNSYSFSPTKPLFELRTTSTTTKGISEKNLVGSKSKNEYSRFPRIVNLRHALSVNRKSRTKSRKQMDATKGKE